MSNTRLQWVHYNRGEPGARPQPPVETERTRSRRQWEAARRGTMVPVGRAVREVVEGRSRLSVQERRLLALFDEEGGPEFTQQVATLSLRRGVLRIGTSDGVTLYDLRLRWEQRLLQAVQKRMPELGIHMVRFSLMKRHNETALER